MKTHISKEQEESDDVKGEKGDLRHIESAICTRIMKVENGKRQRVKLKAETQQNISQLYESGKTFIKT